MLVSVPVVWIKSPFTVKSPMVLTTLVPEMVRLWYVVLKMVWVVPLYVTILVAALASKEPVVLKGGLMPAYVKAAPFAFVHCSPPVVPSRFPVMMVDLEFVTVIPSPIKTLPPKVMAPAPEPLMDWLLVENKVVPVLRLDAPLEFWVIPFLNSQVGFKVIPEMVPVPESVVSPETKIAPVPLFEKVPAMMRLLVVTSKVDP